MAPDQDVALPQDDDDDVDDVIPASHMSTAGAAFAAQISNGAEQLLGNMFLGAVINNPGLSLIFTYKSPSCHY